ncbi:MAG: hypothetical protein HY645_10335 [Acidobacteria bacterium]|nr:hypothetical protein [Acidobacteriota bacterium]
MTMTIPYIDSWQALAVIRIGLGLYWLSNGVRDFQLGRHKDMGKFLPMMANENRIRWYGRFMKVAVLPNSNFFGYFIPISMLLMGTSLIAGVWTALALLGGIFLCINVLLAFGFSKERPQLALLLFTEVALLLSDSERALSLTEVLRL